jgi:hypothetical protein
MCKRFDPKREIYWCEKDGMPPVAELRRQTRHGHRKSRNTHREAGECLGG